ncbi:acyltransferase family protein [Paenibacillus lautus]|uniref:Acyltransferase n=1 Tax=Paenibacillus lautus TaxID=1401 RepID=A0A385THJ0_PAELA|nr:acyltransferase [Paenibacillus lautus]AYB41917.1 acyltransferase [Paenibacillus lautus]
MKKLEYLEGLRGVAALIVVIAHFGQFFYNRQLFIEQSLISATPLNLIYNGNFAVCIFFILSGYVLSRRYFLERNQALLTSGAIRRYIRLFIPVSFSVILAYFLLVTDSFKYFSIYTLNEMYTTADHNFLKMLKTLTYNIFFTYDSSYNPVLWTMTYEFLGSLLIFSFLALFGKSRKRLLMYLVMITVFWDSYYLAFILGLILSDFKNSPDWNFSVTMSRKFNVSFLLIGVLFASYPFTPVENTIYQYLQVPFLHANFFRFYHIAGAFFIIVVIINSKFLQHLLSYSQITYLGRVSFSVYLLHFPIMSSFSFLVFDKFLKFFSYKISFILTFLISLPLIFVCANFMEKYIDAKGITYSKKLYSKFFK